MIAASRIALARAPAGRRSVPSIGPWDPRRVVTIRSHTRCEFRAHLLALIVGEPVHHDEINDGAPIDGHGHILGMLPPCSRFTSNVRPTTRTTTTTTPAKAQPIGRPAFQEHE